MKFTLEDFRNGKVAIQGDGTQKMQHFLKANMEKNTWEPSAGRGYYYTMKEGHVLGNPGSVPLPIVQFSDLVQPTNLPKAYKGKIADFPQEVVEMMLLRQVEQGNKKDVSVFEKNEWAYEEDGFDWNKSPEGDDFWLNVIGRKKFDVFFDKYPKQQQVIYTKEYIRDNKIAIHCPTEEQFQAIIEHFSIEKLRGSGSSWLMYKENTTIQVYWYSRGQSPEESATFGEVSWAKVGGYTIISASEVLNQQQTNMNKKIIGYNLKDLKYEKAYMAIVVSGNVRGRLNGSAADVTNPNNIQALKDAGVLDLWFEPVYSEEEQYKVGDWVKIGPNASGWGALSGEVDNKILQITKIEGGDGYYQKEGGKYNFGPKISTVGIKIERLATAAEIEAANTTVVSVGGQFNVTVKGKKVFHNSDDITLFVKGIQDLDKSGAAGGYSYYISDIIFNKTGCQNKITKLSDWKKVYDMIK